MNKNEALALIRQEARVVAPGQKYQIDLFRPEDAWGIARLYCSVYGDAYPVDTPYVPELLIAANERKDILTVVARGETGEALGQAALYRSSPPNPRLYEYGQVLVLPEYRNTRIGYLLHQYVANNLMGSDGVDAVFGEAVCSHVFTQKLVSRTGFMETGLEPALMPDGAYEKEGAAGRVSCLLGFRAYRDERRRLFLPSCWQEELSFFMEGTGLDREVGLSVDPIPAEATTDIDVRRFDSAGVVRINVSSAGPEAARLVAEAEAGSPALVQVFLNLGQPWVGRLAEELRERGYFAGGFLPVWFGDDGMLLQKLFVDPAFEAMRLHSERGALIRDMVRKDWERSR